MAETSRDLFASRLGMLAATLGSSVGLGNIWKFPALTGEHGGASFLLVYILSTLVVGLPLMIAELLIGRSTRSNAYQAFKTLSSNRFWWIIGGLGIAGAVTILSFYSDVAGWVFAYIPKALTGSVHTQDPAVAKEAFSSLLACPWKSLFWQWLVLGLTASVILRGASGGIEKAQRDGRPEIPVHARFLAYRRLGGAHGDGAGFLQNVHRVRLHDHIRELFPVGYACAVPCRPRDGLRSAGVHFGGHCRVPRRVQLRF